MPSILKKAQRAAQSVFQRRSAPFVPSVHLDDSKREAHAFLVKMLLENATPIPPHEITFVKVPIGYDETYTHTRKVEFDIRSNGKTRELFVPNERLCHVTITHTAMLDNKLFYLASLQTGKRIKRIIVSSVYCVSLEKEELGPFRPKRTR